jgi:hypothetical protein
MTDENDEPTVKPLGCIPGGLIDLRNMEEMKRRREQGLWVWEWWSYENELKWRKTRAEIIADWNLGCAGLSATNELGEPTAPVTRTL